MSLLPIYTYDQPILRKKLAPVTEITAELVQLVADMHQTLLNAEGIGLAANQIGRDSALTVIDISDTEESDGYGLLTLINPSIVSFSEEESTYEEGCLSLPDMRADVVRPSAIEVVFYDIDMKEHRMEADRLLARVMQHEIDHLNGVYFFDHLKPMRRALLKRQLAAISRGEVDADYPLFRGDV